MSLKTITGDKPPPYAALLRESAARYVLAFQRDEGFRRWQVRTEFWAAFRRYRIQCQALAEMLIEREHGRIH